MRKGKYDGFVVEIYMVRRGNPFWGCLNFVVYLLAGDVYLRICQEYLRGGGGAVNAFRVWYSGAWKLCLALCVLYLLKRFRETRRRLRSDVSMRVLHRQRVMLIRDLCVVTVSISGVNCVTKSLRMKMDAIWWCVLVYVDWLDCFFL